MKLVFAKEMQSLDQQSAEQIGLPTMVLMENAGKAVAETAADFLEDCFGKNIVVFTGKGNNGGDGFAAARWAFQQRRLLYISYTPRALPTRDLWWRRLF